MGVHCEYSCSFRTVYVSDEAQLAFDVFTLVLAITNALERPYRHNVEIIVNFKRDGAVFFLVRRIISIPPSGH